MAVLSILLVAAFVLSACQPVVQTVEVIQTQIVEREVEVVTTQEVEVVQTQVVEVEKGAFTTPHPILSDLKVRQAIAHCTNKLELVQSVYPLISPEEQEALVMDSWIPRASWAYAGDDNITAYPFDPEAGMALLDEAGWTMAAEDAEFRTNAAGDALSLKFTTTTAAFRQTWAAVFEQQMANCGIQIVRLHAPASWWFGDTTGLQRRDYELGAYAWVGQADPGGQSLYACEQIPFPENNWEGQNTMGWCNETASKAIVEANNSLDQEVRKQAYLEHQQEFTKDLPSLPLFNRTETYAFSPNLAGFVPPNGTGSYTFDSYKWEIPGNDTIVLGFVQEPASLFLLVESAQVASTAYAFLDYYVITDQDFNFQPFMQTELSTLESGLAQNNDVEVNEGDRVYDVTGQPVDLAAGVMVKDATGADVEFSGSPITMKQLVVTYQFADGITWSDGEPLKAADLELFYKINCDPESGATSFATCDTIQTWEVPDDKSVTVTYLPGSQSPTYFLYPTFYAGFGLGLAYPSHRVLADGRTLGDVPASEWSTLPEVAESPIGVGPYVLKEWVKGERLVYEANPYFYLGEPVTKNLVISIVTAENAEAQLLGGQVDLLDSTVLAGVSEALKTAADAGQIKIEIGTGGTWEHIDFQLFSP
jgi:ABC-type transport system substrate-binding protein